MNVRQYFTSKSFLITVTKFCVDLCLWQNLSRLRVLLLRKMPSLFAKEPKAKDTYVDPLIPTSWLSYRTPPAPWDSSHPDIPPDNPLGADNPPPPLSSLAAHVDAFSAPIFRGNESEICVFVYVCVPCLCPCVSLMIPWSKNVYLG